MGAATLWLLGSALSASASVARAAYALDEAWRPALPQGTGTFSAVAVSGDRIFVGQRDARYPEPVLVLSRSGALLGGFGHAEVAAANGTWGNHGLSIQRADLAAGRHEDIVWIMDFFNFGVFSFTLDGKLLGQAGRGSEPSADLDKFGSVADAAFRGDSAFISDGDGCCNNRVERWSAASGRPEKVVWVSPGGSDKEFNNPHSICLHQPSDTLIIADREHGRLTLMDPDSGAVRGHLSCDALGLGTQGMPFGVRTLKTAAADILFVATANSPQDGGHQFVHVVDVSGLGETGACRVVLQTIPIDAELCRTPHLMGIDHQTGDVYIACVAAPRSNLIRLIAGQEVVV